MVQFKPLKPLPVFPSEGLPTEQDLPDSDNCPVDNELQLLSPTLLRVILHLIWPERTDWFMGVNLGLYYDPAMPAVGPDAFLSLGAPIYRPDKDLRLSYLLWEEGVVPQWVLEIVSKTPGKEYDQKMALYARLGVQYYVIHNPKYFRRDRHDPFEVYKLEGDEYVRLPGNPVWMPEIGLGIGVASGVHYNLPERDWLYWYDQQGNQYPAPDRELERTQHELEQAQRKIEQAQQKVESAQQQAETAQQQMEALLQKLRDRNIDPDTL